MSVDEKPAVGHRWGMSKIQIAQAGMQEQVALQNLLQLYTHDFSGNWAGTARGDVDQQGRFPPYPLDVYWEAPSHAPLLIRFAGHIAGFALLNDHGHSGLEIDRNVAEFFILRKYRRNGIGTAAAHALFSLYPGMWEAAVARKNVAALEFWRHAFSSYHRAGSLSEIDMVSAEWDGPVLRFNMTA
jgi:predicted acetyltransferase